MIPLACHVYFVPSPTKDFREQGEKILSQGIFLGYRTAPGGKWTGDYLVADLNDFARLPLLSTAEPGMFKNVRPHVTRTVNWTREVPLSHSLLGRLSTTKPSMGSNSARLT